MRKVIGFICCSLDGYIAGENGDMSFLERIPQTSDDHGYSELLSRIDTVLVGRKTHDWVMTQVEKFPHKHIESYVVGRGAPLSYANRYDGNPVELVSRLKEIPARKDIYCDGGSQLLNSLIEANLIDEIVISIAPFVLGGGTPLFTAQSKQAKFKLESVKQFESGLVQMRYSLT